MPAGIYASTPFPVTETSTSYVMKTDEDPEGKTYFLGTKYFVDGKDGDDSKDGLSMASARKTINAAKTAAGSGNKTIIVRGAHGGWDGVYYETVSFYGISGLDDTHRLMLVGYGNERPTIDGGNTTSGIIRRLHPDPAYVTIQRLKLQNTLASGVRLGRDVAADKWDRYFNCIDIWFYQCGSQATRQVGTHTGPDNAAILEDASKSWDPNYYSSHSYSVKNITDQSSGAAVQANSTTTVTCTLSGGQENDWDSGDEYAVYYVTSGSCYYLNADDGLISHCRSERSWGHGFKVGDGASHCILEWSVSSEHGYWPGIDPPYILARTVALDLPSDRDTPTDNTVRYCVAHSCGSHGLQLRRQANFHVHHNEIYQIGWMGEYLRGRTGGVTPSGVTMLGGSTSGRFHSNIIRDPAHSRAKLLSVTVDNSTSTGVSIYNNLFYGGSDEYLRVAAYGATLTPTKVFNNSFFASTDNAIVDEDGGAQATLSGNIFYQNGPGKCVEYQSSTVHDHNLYFAPNGSLGTRIDSETGWQTPTSQNFWTALPSGGWSHGEATLAGTSPAIGTALNLSSDFTADANSVVRPATTGWSMGAFEASTMPKPLSGFHRRP